jgi:hypothetical protein
MSDIQPTEKEIALGDLVEVAPKTFEGWMKKYNGAKGEVARLGYIDEDKAALVAFVNAQAKDLYSQFVRIKDLIVTPRREIYGEND